MMPEPADGRALGRLHIPDGRDASFPMAAPPPKRHFRNWLVPGGIMDQGNKPHCVAFAIVAYLRAHPVVNAHTETLKVDTTDLYDAAQRVDQWPGEAYDGTSVRAGFAVLKARGLVKSYAWAWDSGTIARHILEIGPVVVGTLWTGGMHYPDANHYLRPKVGSVYGGHAYMLTATDTQEVNPDGSVGRFRVQNSHGERYGDGGRGWITFDDMDLLMRHDGEACTALETRVRLAA